MQPISPLITSTVRAAEQGRSYKAQLYLAQRSRYAVIAGRHAKARATGASKGRLMYTLQPPRFVLPPLNCCGRPTLWPMPGRGIRRPRK